MSAVRLIAIIALALTSSGVAPAAPLHDAVLTGDVERVNALVESGIDVNAQDETQRTALILAADQGYIAVVQSLLEHGANVDAGTESGNTALHRAALRGDSATVMALLGHGADPNATSNAANTPLHVAAHRGHAAVVWALIAGGAALAVRDNVLDATPLHLAAREGHIDIVALLLRMGVDASETTDAGATPLHLAAHRGHRAVAEALLDTGADISARDGMTGDTALHLAAARGFVALAKLLLVRGADPNARNTDGAYSPLHIAVAGEDRLMAGILLAHDADPDQLDDSNRSPLVVAAEIGSVGLIELLRQHQSDRDAVPAAHSGGEASLTMVSLSRSEPELSRLALNGTDMEAAPGVGDAYVALKNGVIRAGPSSLTRRLGLLSGGSTVTVRGIEGGGHWYHIDHPQFGSGYVYATVLESLSSVKARSREAVPRPASSNFRSLVPSLQPTVYKASRNAIVRQGPSVDSPRIGLIAGGTTVEVVEKIGGASWYRVNRAGRGDGYVYAPLLVPDRQLAGATQPVSRKGRL